MKTRLKLFFKWEIAFENAYSIEEKADRKVQYADSQEVETAVLEMFPARDAMPVPAEFAENFEGMIDEDALSRKHPPKTRKRIT